MDREGLPLPRPPLRIEQTVIWAESRQFSVTGDLDQAGAVTLKRLLAGAVRSGLPCIVLDLSACEVLDAVRSASSSGWNFSSPPMARSW